MDGTNGIKFINGVSRRTFWAAKGVPVSFAYIGESLNFLVVEGGSFDVINGNM